MAFLAAAAPLLLGTLAGPLLNTIGSKITHFLGLGGDEQGGSRMAHVYLKKNGISRSHPYMGNGRHRNLQKMDLKSRRNPYGHHSRGGFVSPIPSSVGYGRKGGDISNGAIVPLESIPTGPIP